MTNEDFSTDHKTVFILDHGSCMRESSKQMVDFDISTKSRPPGVVPLAPVSKSIWSACIEALCEYCRIVWDIFHVEKLLRFIVSDCSAQFLNSWAHEEQNMLHLMKALAGVGPPLKKVESSVMLGVVSAVEALCDVTPSQSKALKEGRTVENRGRIVCITQLKNDTPCKAIVECVVNAVTKHSDLASKSKGMLPITCVELVIIHVKPFGSDCCITEIDLSPYKGNQKILLETHDVKATRHGVAIANRMLNLVRRHYDLSVTSITGIPMKEEQHANSSANYDVLLLHRRLPGTPLVEPERSTWDGELCSTMLLKWCTPKIDTNELFYCTGAARISPVDVNSRPSLCLTNFLLNGRSVSLEHWIKGADGGAGSSASGLSTRQMTHMISCRGSDIFLHALGVNRTPFEDPPSISDGVGGKVTDYRINDFSDIIRKSQLLPLGGQSMDLDIPEEGAQQHVERLTRCWPLVFSKTILFNMSKSIDPILDLVLQKKLTAEDVVSCQRVIYHLIGLEREGVALPVVTSSGGLSRSSSKQNRKEEHYKSLWKELETFLRSHSSTSSQHQEVLECLLECTGKMTSQNGNTLSKPTTKSADDKRTDAGSDVFESPESPPPVKKQKSDADSSLTMRPQKGAQSLLAMWTQRIENTNSQRHVEFYGRLASDGNKARLYPNIEEDNNAESANNQQGGNDRQGGRHGLHRFSQHHRSGSGGGRDDSGRSGRSTPQGKQKIMKKLPKSYANPS